MVKARRLPSLNAIKAFDAAARYEGFAAAGGELLVSAGAVSRHISNLEDYFGVALFSRRNNEINLTQAGEQYFTRIRPALDLIEDASRGMVRHANRREVHVAAPATFAARWLIPRLSDFAAAFPGVEIQISTTSSQFCDVGFDDNGPDVTIHCSHADIASDSCDPLFAVELQAVCHPRFLHGARSLRAPQDLTDHMLLYSLNRLTLWRQWFTAAGVDPDLTGRSVKFASSAMALQACVDGLGVACAETAFVADDIENGRLVSPFATRLRPGGKYFLSVNAERPSAGATAFRSWSLNQFNAQEAMPSRLEMSL